METRRWINHSLPPWLGNAVILLYVNAGIGALLGGYLSHPIGVALVAGGVGAGYGIANEQRWGYNLGLAVAFAPFALAIAYGGGVGGLFRIDIISLLFDILLVALLLHPTSREHQRIWFS